MSDTPIYDQLMREQIRREFDLERYEAWLNTLVFKKVRWWRRFYYWLRRE